MKSYLAGIVLLALPCVLPSFAQEKQNFVFNPSSPEGQMLQNLGQETDDARKVAVGQDFLAKYPKHEAAGWVASQVESGLLAQKEYDKVLETAEMVWATSPDMDAAYYALKAAVEKNDVEKTKEWSARTFEQSHKLTAGAKPPANDDDKHQLEYAKEVGEYADYGLYVVALKAQPKEEVDLIDTLIKQDPQSQYLSEVANSYFAALGKAGESGKVCTMADKMAVGKNAEAMLEAADCAWRGNKAASVLSFAGRATEALNTRAKREGVSDSEWATEKSGLLGMAEFYTGIGNAMEMRWGPANRALKGALPSLKGNQAYYGVALFDLGLANYSLGKAVGDNGQKREGLKYFQESAGIAGPMQDQASRNAKLVLAELGGR